MMRAGGLLLAICATLALGACAKAPVAVAPTPERDLIEANLMRDISLLASDEFGGRRPGTPGEELTVAHIIEQLELAGFQSGTLQLYQVLFAPRGNNEVPTTRRYQFEPVQNQDPSAP